MASTYRYIAGKTVEAGSYGDITKYHIRKIPTSLRARLSSVWKPILAIIATMLTPMIAAIALPLVLAVILSLISCGILFISVAWLSGKLRARINVIDVHKNLRDEARALCEALVAVNTAREALPHGDEIQERAREFGRLAYLLMDKMKELNSDLIREVGYNYMNTDIEPVRDEAKNLAKSGNELAKMIARRQVTSIVEDVDVIGVSHFIEQVNLDTMVNRSLESGSK